MSEKVSPLLFLTSTNRSNSNAKVIVVSLSEGCLSLFSPNLNLYITCFPIKIMSLRSFAAVLGRSSGNLWNMIRSRFKLTGRAFSACGFIVYIE